MRSSGCFTTAFKDKVTGVSIALACANGTILRVISDLAAPVTLPPSSVSYYPITLQFDVRRSLSNEEALLERHSLSLSLTTPAYTIIDESICDQKAFFAYDQVIRSVASSGSGSFLPLVGLTANHTSSLSTFARLSNDSRLPRMACGIRSRPEDVATTISWHHLDGGAYILVDIVCKQQRSDTSGNVAIRVVAADDGKIENSTQHCSIVSICNRVFVLCVHRVAPARLRWAVNKEKYSTQRLEWRRRWGDFEFEWRWQYVH